MPKQTLNPFHQKIVFFEGLDKTGKTTLARRCRFEALPAHPAIMLDRGFIGRKVFWHFNHEPEFPIEAWHVTESILAEHGLYAVVWLRSSYKVVCERHVTAGEEPPASGTYIQQDRLYELFMKERIRQGVPVLEVNTDTLTEDHTVQKILHWMKFGWKGDNGGTDR